MIIKVKIFISHKEEDKLDAEQVAEYLKTHSNGVSCYLDVLDSGLLSHEGDDLGEYFRKKLGECTHLMAVVSEDTKSSWWVPFEIGIATEKQYPISTFAIQDTNLPSYLKKWPYLRDESDLDKYIHVALSTQPHILTEGLEKATVSEKGSYTRTFHKDLKKALRQADEH